MREFHQDCPRCGAPGSSGGMGGGRGMGGGGRGMGGGGRGMGGGSRGMGGGSRSMVQGGFSAGAGTTSAAVPGIPGAGFTYPDRTAHRVKHIAQIRADIAPHQSGALTAEERDDLLLMREEEKIARDVYLRLYEQWGIRPFDNIAGAEQAHMDAILALLEHHGLPDPASGLAIGRFHSTELQSLHDQLVQDGLRSREDAIRIGLLIEELDIADLQKAARRTDKTEILAVYAELERGSRNHLRAFYRWKQGLGIDYQTEHLPQDEFERIGLSAHEECE